MMPLMFVIFGIQVDGVWVNMKDFMDVCAPDHFIYNIMRFKTYRVTISADNVDAARSYMEQVTQEVDSECPFAKELGFVGVGEGIVWTSEEDPNDTALWFKTKGTSHTRPPNAHLVSKDDPARKVTLTEARIAGVRDLLDQRLNDARFRQGLESLHQLQPVTNEHPNPHRFLHDVSSGPLLLGQNGTFGEAMKAFAEWVVDDLCKESKEEIVKNSLNADVVGKCARGKAIAWFKDTFETDGTRKRSYFPTEANSNSE